ncbi:hypothetical protein GCM10009751_22750 [Myceligenerans crystallogenes]|uniref:NAD(P)-binding domain-containing protein n=1 Tax=Myceligenerans crystallogenes TaxID=316335 RepID=A0ABN2NGL6_9MICO
MVLAGAGGAVGAQLAFRLAAEGTEQRMIVPGRGQEPSLPDGSPLPDSETIVLGHTPGRPELATALEGAETLVIAGAAHRDPDPFALIRAAAELGVGRILHLSHIGASEQAVAMAARRQWLVEQEVRASGATWTILQCSILFGALVRSVHDDVLRAPAGHGRAAAVSNADVADAVTAVLLDERVHVHDRVTYRITGPTALSGPEIAAALSVTIGRVVRYEPVAARDLYSTPIPWVRDLDAWISCCAAVDAGVYEQVSDAVPALAGRPARAFWRWLDDYPVEWLHLGDSRDSGTAM